MFYQNTQSFVKVNYNVLPRPVFQFLTLQDDGKTNLWYTNGNQSYLILKSNFMDEQKNRLTIKDPTFIVEEKILNIHYTTMQNTEKSNESSYIIYKINNVKQYDTVKLFRNNNEIAFDVSGN